MGKFEIRRDGLWGIRRDGLWANSRFRENELWEICYLDGGEDLAPTAGVRGGRRPGWRRGSGVRGGGGRLERRQLRRAFS
jgi:hypothetical protein